MNPICDACGEGHTTPETEVVDYIYEGITHHVTMFYQTLNMKTLFFRTGMKYSFTHKNVEYK